MYSYMPLTYVTKYITNMCINEYIIFCPCPLLAYIFSQCVLFAAAAAASVCCVIQLS